MLGSDSPLVVRLIDGPRVGEIWAAPAGSASFRTPVSAWGRTVVVEYVVRPAPPGIDELWVGLAQGWPTLVHRRRCDVCERLAPVDRLLVRGATAVCDICCWDSTSWARTDRRVA